MYAYGLFFDRHDEEVLDFEITEDQCRRILNEDDEEDDVIGKGIKAFVVESSIRGNFANIDELIKRAKEGKPIVLNDEESLIALAGTPKQARAAFLKARTEELADMHGVDDEDDDGF